jgi:CMP-N-acetylneuraminic acid synthetase
LRDLIRRLRAEGEPATIMILLEPTCPLRSAPDVSACLQTLVDGKDSVATFRQAELNPHRAWAITDGCPVPFISGAIPWLPRQKLPEAYQLNGAVYAFFTDRLPTDGRAVLFGKAGAVMMPKERSIDIDDEADFERIEALLRRRANVQDPA